MVTTQGMEHTMTRQGRSFNEHLDSYEKKVSKRERRIYDEKRIQFAVANQIMERRKALNMTQADLSNLTGVSQPEISRIETGMANPTVGTLGRIAEGLKTHIGLVDDEQHQLAI